MSLSLSLVNCLLLSSFDVPTSKGLLLRWFESSFKMQLGCLAFELPAEFRLLWFIELHPDAESRSTAFKAASIDSDPRSRGSASIDCLLLRLLDSLPSADPGRLVAIGLATTSADPWLQVVWVSEGGESVASTNVAPKACDLTTNTTGLKTERNCLWFYMQQLRVIFRTCISRYFCNSVGAYIITLGNLFMLINLRSQSQNYCCTYEYGTRNCNKNKANLRAVKKVKC